MASTSDPHRGAAIQDWLSRLVARKLFWTGLVAMLFAWPVAWTLRTRLPAPLPTLSVLPAFELRDQEGHAFGTEQLRGRVWVAGFIFTRCPTICPATTAQMARIQARTRQLAPHLHLVSFSVDPEYDTPERLAAYARLHRASPRMWSFLTGPADAVAEAVVGGLKIAMEPQRTADGGFAGVLHGSHLVLVDAAGRVRGYYDSLDAREVDRLVRDAGLLVNRGS